MKNSSSFIFRKIFVTATLLGAIGVALGAFGAHVLKSSLTPEDLDAYKTAVNYLFIHVLAALFTTIVGRAADNPKLLKWAGRAFLTGIFLFSGSIFLLTTREITGLHLGFLGPVTPVGGLCFIAGWICLALNGLPFGQNRVE
jgi:uncharacterized membrane protein YgdD (TMEM256/DUF423 family)